MARRKRSHQSVAAPEPTPEQFMKAWLDYMHIPGYQKVIEGPYGRGFCYLDTGEVMCPFRAVPCLKERCNWWEHMVMHPRQGNGYLYECWFFLGKYSIVAGQFSDCPSDPEEVMKLFRTAKRVVDGVPMTDWGIPPLMP